MDFLAILRGHTARASWNFIASHGLFCFIHCGRRRVTRQKRARRPTSSLRVYPIWPLFGAMAPSGQRSGRRAARYFGERGSVVRFPKGRGDPFITNDSDVSKGLGAMHCGGLGNCQFAFLSLSVSFGTPGNYFVDDLLAMRTEPQNCRFDIGHSLFGLHHKNKEPACVAQRFGSPKAPRRIKWVTNL